MDSPRMTKILEICSETPTVKTFKLDMQVDARPGQFAMLWLPGVGEKPFSFSRMDPDVEITVRSVGDFTREMFKLDAGDQIGFRGPYGDGSFSLSGKNICIVSGGVGLAPLMPLIRECIAESLSLKVLCGAAKKSELMWTDFLGKQDLELHLATDDGSCGTSGSVCDVFESLVASGGIDLVCTCGPELMMKRIADTCVRRDISCQVSLERYMKCGTGLCGQCCIDPTGLRVCKEGPVFDAKTLIGSEFGKYKRDNSGSRKKLC